jgi:hypothetical protein
MAEIVYKSLSSLSPIELKYEYNRNESLQANTITYRDGLSFYEIEGLNNFQDVAINRDTCLILTSAVSLSTVFTPSTNIEVGKLPGSFILQPRNSSIYFLKHNPNNNSLVQTLTSASIIYLQPVNGTNEVELFIDNKYVQVDAFYPYRVYLGDRTLDPEDIQYQRFETVYEGGFITFKTKTTSGYRYLAFNNDNILRATGLVLNDTVVNDYVFNCLPVTKLTLDRGFIPTNSWVTYYFDFESGAENKTVVVNKTIDTTPTNFLINLPIEQAAEKGIVKVNIANLKTNLTPAGGAASVDNSYNKNVITTN